MRRSTLFLAGALALALAAPALAAPSRLLGSTVAQTPPQGRTIAVVPLAGEGAEALEALARGLDAAGYRVVGRAEHPDLLAGFSVRTTATCGVYCNVAYTHGANTSPAGSVVDPYRRDLLVVAWRPQSPAPTRGSVVWFTALTSGGLSRDPRDFEAAMLAAGASAYGRTVGPQG